MLCTIVYKEDKKHKCNCQYADSFLGMLLWSGYDETRSLLFKKTEVSLAF